MVKTIYLKDETNEALKKIKEQESDFNLSEFVGQAILSYSQTGETVDGNMVNEKLSFWKAKEAEAQDNLRYWEGKEKDFLVQEEMKKKAIEDEKEKEKEHEMKKEQKRITANEAFKDIVERDMTDEEWEEYSNTAKGSIWGYADKVKERDSNVVH